MENTMISQRIRHYRRMAKMSQEELADRVDVSETYIRKLEAGDRFPSLDMVIKLSQALNTNARSSPSLQQRAGTEQKLWGAGSPQRLHTD